MENNDPMDSSTIVGPFAPLAGHWTQDDVDVNGARFHYYRTNAGNTGKPALVLQHGFSDNGLCWQQVASDFEDEFDVIMPDARGHGLSQRVAKGEALDQAADLAGVMQALGVEKAVVAGHSMGGLIASQLGARFPQLVRGLILEDPAWFTPQPGEQAARPLSENSPMYVWMMGLKAQTIDQVMAGCRAEHPTWHELVVQRWCQGKFQLDPNFFSTGQVFEADWQSIARAITCPTLLVTCEVEMGGIVSPEMAQKAVELNPQIQLAHIPGVGHHVRFNDYAAYMSAVQAFLKSL